MDFFAALDAAVPGPAIEAPPIPTVLDPTALLERLQTGWRFRRVLYRDTRTVTGRLDEVELGFDGHRYVWIERALNRRRQVVSEVRWHIDRLAMHDRLRQRPDVARVATSAALGEGAHR